MVDVVDNWWKNCGRIRGARIDKHFVQHEVGIVAPTRVVEVSSTQ